MKKQLLLLGIIGVLVCTLLVSFTKPVVEESKRYIVVQQAYGSNDNQAFVKQVNDYLAQGWHLQGGVSSVDGSHLVQALVK